MRKWQSCKNRVNYPYNRYNIVLQFFLMTPNWETAKYRGRKKKSGARGLRDKRDCADLKPRPGREAGLNTFPLRYSASFTRQRRFSLWCDSQMHSFCADSQREREAGMDRLYPLDLFSWETAGGVTLCNYGATTELRCFTSFSYLCLKLCPLRGERQRERERESILNIL